MGIRLYVDSNTAVIHVARRDATETYCGIGLEDLRPVGTIDAPSSFTPQPGALHDDCLTGFVRRHDHDGSSGTDRDVSSGDESTGWQDLGDVSD